MTRTGHIVIGGILLLVGLLLVLMLILLAGSPRAWIHENYRRVSHNPATESAVYLANRQPSQVLYDLTDRWKPYQRLNDPSGYFLRYRDLVVRISDGDQGGSRIQVEDDERGYHVWGPVIGGAWGTYRGPGEGFRGGGPGAGK